MTGPGAEGLLVVDKPSGWTSHDVVGRVRRLCGTRRVGHAGTLDPMATGVLVVGIERATKLLTFLVGCDKSYQATIRLGMATRTDDAEGEVMSIAPPGRVVDLSDSALRAAAAQLVGDIMQVPSAVSAIKVDGERAYARVRRGDDVELPARPATVHRFDMPAMRRGESALGPYLDVDVEVDVSSGTYVRALARDLGAALGVGGHLTALRRTRVGRFAIESATTMEDLGRIREEQGVPALPIVSLADAAAAQFPVRRLTADESADLGYGRRILRIGDEPRAVVAALGPSGDLVAMLDESQPVCRSHVVFTGRG